MTGSGRRGADARSGAGLARDRRGSSSVIASKLLIAIVVVLSSGAFGYVALGVDTQPVSPQAKFSFEYAEGGTADSLAVRHTHGDTIDGGQVTLAVTGAAPGAADGTYRWNGTVLDGAATVRSGDQVRLDAARLGGDTLDLNAATVRLIWTSADGDDAYVLDTWQGPAARQAGAESGDTDGGASGDGAPAIRAVTAHTGALDEGDDVYDNVTFVLENAGDGDVFVTKLAVNATSTGATFVSHGANCEVQTNRTACALDVSPSAAHIDIGRAAPYSLTTVAVLPAGSQTRFYVSNFENESGSVEMEGETVTLTLYYANGGQQTFELTVPAS